MDTPFEQPRITNNAVVWMLPLCHFLDDKQTRRQRVENDKTLYVIVSWIVHKATFSGKVVFLTDPHTVGLRESPNYTSEFLLHF